MTESGGPAPVGIAALEASCQGVVPAVVATAGADGTPNVTYLSRVHIVDGERVALSNQFFSKTSRNIAENPFASVLVIDPQNYDEYRISIRYERTERTGRIFEAVRRDVDMVAALQGMQDVFRLRAADIYRVESIEKLPSAASDSDGEAVPAEPRRGTSGGDPAAIAELSARLSRCPDLDTLVSSALDGLAEVLGFDHSLLMLVDESGARLFTIGSHGYANQGVGSEIEIGAGIIGMAAAQCRPARVGNIAQARKYSRTVRRSFEAGGQVEPGTEIPMPGLSDAGSQLAVPAMALGRIVGVLMVESPRSAAFDANDEAVLSVVAAMIAAAIEIDAARERSEPAEAAASSTTRSGGRGSSPVTQVRFFAADGSVFLGTDYLIKGVAGRVLWSLLNHHAHDGRADFTNREVRLDPSLELPEFRDNLESRLILLKRRLDERAAPIRIDKTGRGRFRLVVETPLQLDAVAAT